MQTGLYNTKNRQAQRLKSLVRSALAGLSLLEDNTMKVKIYRIPLTLDCLKHPNDRKPEHKCDNDCVGCINNRGKCKVGGCK